VEHNRAVGGVTRSKHLDGATFDIARVSGFEAAAREVGFLGFGFYPRSGFIQVDLGPSRQLGERFPARPVPFAAETPHAREVLADSRTMKGGGAAGVATLSAAGVEIMRQGGAENLLMVDFSDPAYVGKTLQDVMDELGKDPLETAVWLQENGLDILGGALWMAKAVGMIDIEEWMRQDYTAVSLDRGARMDRVVRLSAGQVI